MHAHRPRFRRQGVGRLDSLALGRGCHSLTFICTNLSLAAELPADSCLATHPCQAVLLQPARLNLEAIVRKAGPEAYRQWIQLLDGAG